MAYKYMWENLGGVDDQPQHDLSGINAQCGKCTYRLYCDIVVRPILTIYYYYGFGKDPNHVGGSLRVTR